MFIFVIVKINLVKRNICDLKMRTIYVCRRSLWRYDLCKWIAKTESSKSRNWCNMQSGNEKLNKCCCSITKVNSTERTMFLTWFLSFIFFPFSQSIHSFPTRRRFRSRVHVDEIHNHYTSNRKRVRSTIFSFYFKSNIVQM